MQQIQIQCSVNFLDKKPEDSIFQIKNSLKHHTPNIPSTSKIRAPINSFNYLLTRQNNKNRSAQLQQDIEKDLQQLKTHKTQVQRVARNLSFFEPHTDHFFAAAPSSCGVLATMERACNPDCNSSASAS